MKPVTIINNGNLRSAGITLPISKSISNRLLVLQFLSGRDFAISGLSNSDDTRLMSTLLKEIKWYLRNESEELLKLDADNAGTVMRFITAAVSMQPGNYFIFGDERMHSRPINDLVDALRSLGAEIKYRGKEGCPPLEIEGKPLQGGTVKINTDQSSQFLTALMLIAPFLPGGLRINVQGKRLSWPYVEMTLQLLRKSGVELKADGDLLVIEPKRFGWMPAEIELDWSSAAFWYELAAIDSSLMFTFPRLSFDSIQGDVILKDLFRTYGVTSRETGNAVSVSAGGRETDETHLDLSFFPDIVIPLVVTSCCKRRNIEIKGIDHLRFKESDRLSSLSNELVKIGCRFLEVSDNKWALDTSGLDLEKELTFKVYNDHRMAMAFAMLASVAKKVTLDHGEVVSKSYPGFWDDMKRAGFKVIME